MPPMAAAAAASSSMSVGNYSLFLNRLTANLSFPSSSSSSSSTAATKTRKPKPHQVLTHPQPLHHHHHHLHLLPFFSTTATSSSSFVAASAYDDAAVNEEEEEEEEEVEEKRRLYVGNLPYSMTSSQLADIFQEAGQVHAVEIVYDRVTDRSRGFAFVTMGSVEEAKQAIRMFNGSQVGGRSVKVNFPEVPRGGEKEIMGPRIRSSSRGYVDSPYKVYAGNLGWRLTSETLKEAFESQPGLLGAKVIYERDSGRSRGFGFVSFASPEEAESAIDAMNGVEVEGRPLRLSLAAQKTTTAAATETTQEIRTDTVGNEMQSTVAY